MSKRTARLRWFSVGRAVAFCALAAAFVACGHTGSNGDEPGNLGGGGVGGAGGRATAGKSSGGSDVAGKSASMPVGGRTQDPPASAGAGGVTLPIIPGVSTTPTTLMCGGQSCRSIKTLLPNAFVDPCCAADDACGVSTEVLGALGASFTETCQAQHQAGARDAACPSSAPRTIMAAGVAVPVQGFAGCCRAETGTCGVIVDDISAIGLGVFTKPQLGCADSAPFFDGRPGASCGSGQGGASSGGEGGEPPVVNPDPGSAGQGGAQ